MKITFRQSGGFGGFIQGCELDTDLLAAEEAAKLRSLLQNSGIVQAKREFTPKARDLYNYEITVETNERTFEVLLDDLTMPESAYQLLDYLQDRAEPLPPR